MTDGWGWTLIVIILIVIIVTITIVAVRLKRSSVTLLPTPSPIQPSPPIIVPPINPSPPVLQPPIVVPPSQPLPPTNDRVVIRYQSAVQLLDTSINRVVTAFTDQNGICGNPVVLALPTALPQGRVRFLLASNINNTGNIAYGDLVRIQFLPNGRLLTVCRVNSALIGCGVALSATNQLAANALDSTWSIEGGGAGVTLRSGDRIQLRLNATDRYIKNCSQLILGTSIAVAALSDSGSPDTFSITIV